MFDYQKFYDTTRVALIEQGAKALQDQGTCVYRAKNGNKCAIGHNLPEELYFPEMEGKGGLRLLSISPMLCEHWDIDFDAVRRADIKTCVLDDIPVGNKSHDLSPAKFMEELQKIHDSNEPYQWPRMLIKLAKDWGLRP